MEHRSDGAKKEASGFHAVEKAKAALRAEGPAPLRPGQVVPGRAAAALVAVVLLAQGRRADLGQPGPGRRRKRGLRRERKPGRAIPARARQPSRSEERRVGKECRSRWS